MKLSSLGCAFVLVIFGTGALAQQARPVGAAPRVQVRHNWNVAPDLPPALKAMLRAVGSLRYSGTRVIEAKSGANRQRHTEIVMTDGPRTRIEFPEGSPLHGQLIVETTSDRRQYNPNRNELQILPPRREEAFGRIAQMVAKRNITVTETSGGAVAGKPSELVTLADKRGNALQKLWIEPSTGMILKREIYDRTGTMIASFEFTDINLHPIIRPGDFTTPKGAVVITPDMVRLRIAKRQGFQDVTLPADLPYKLEGAHMQKLALQQVLVQQYAGNGHRVTLYQLKTQVDPNRLGMLERPDLQIYSWQAGGSSFVLVGDLSDAEIRNLARRMGG